MSTEKKGSKSLYRKLVKFGLFISGAVGPIKTVYSYLSEGKLAKYGLLTKLSLKTLVMNCGYVTGMFLIKLIALYLAFCLAWPFLLIYFLFKPLVVIGVAYLIIFLYFRLASRLSLASYARWREYRRFLIRCVRLYRRAVVRMFPWPDSFWSFLAIIGVCTATLLDLASFVFFPANPLNLRLELSHPVTKAITYVGLLVLVVAYGMAYKQVSDYLKELERDDQS